MKKGEVFKFGPWTVNSTKGPILKASEVEKISTDLELPSIPEMVFGENRLQIEHKAGFGIQFNAIDALRHVDNKHDLMKVAVADEWQRKRQDSEYIKKVVKPFDWTYSTDYTGTLIGQGETQLKVLPADERIDMEKLKVKETIHFYEDVVLFEDELADNGVSKLNVKMRVMPSSFFVLLRFYLRVDGVLVRVNDTRIFHQGGTSYFLREYTSKERKVSELKCPYADPSELLEYLEMKQESFEKLQFPSNVDGEEK